MSELGQFDSVFFACKRLVVTALPYIIDLNRFVALRGHTELARVIEVDRKHMSGALRGLAVLGIISWEELAESAHVGIGFIQLDIPLSAGKLK